MDLELRFKKILEKYNLAGSSSNNDKRIYQEIKKIINKKLKDKKVIIRGGGVHTVKFINDFGKLINIVGVVDQNVEATEKRLTQYKIPIYAVEQMKDIEFDIVIIGVHGIDKQLKQEFKHLNKEQIFDIYKELELESCKVEYPYYNPYTSIIKLNNAYKIEAKVQEKEKILEEIIIRYLENRDLFSAKKYIKEYINNNYTKSNLFSALEHELNELMIELKALINEREYKDIVWFWHDALCYEFVKYMPFMNRQRENGMFFKNAYTSSTWTRRVYEVIFNKTLELDGYSEEKKENIIVNYLNEKGYKCIRIGGIANKVKALDEFDYANEPILDLEVSTTQYYWKLLCEVVNSEKPVFALVHTMYETHAPICSPNLEVHDSNAVTIEKRLTQEGRDNFYNHIKQTILYLDNITEYLCELLGEKMIKIFMSDHGHILSAKTRKWMSDINHINFIVTGKDIPRLTCDKLFTLYNFYEVIQFIMEPSKERLDHIFMEELLLQAQDTYHQDFIERLIKMNFEEYAIAYRGVQTLKDKYILLGTGKEIYNVLPDEHTNYIEDTKYKERIEYLRKKAGTYFIDISQDEKFKYTNRLYESMREKGY